MAVSGWLSNNSSNIRLRSADFGDVAPAARFDDLRTRYSVVLMDLVDTNSVSQLDDIVELLDTAETHARLGSWVAVVLAYEAGAAFDAAFPRRSPPPGVRLAWFAAFSSCERVEPVTRPSAWATPMRVQRRGGSEWFMAGVSKCRHMIEQGSTYQVNLTDRFDGVLADAPFELYRAMATAQGGAFNAYLDLGDRVVVSASPELFLHVDNDHVTARPMKGTAGRRPRPLDDQRTGEDLVESDKDRAENVMIVDLMRNDLSRLAPYGGVSVPSLFAAERYETVWQLTSTVAARIRPELSLVDVLRATFPCGSVTGAPKVAAMRFIDEMEPWPRGVYCGAIGLITPNAPADRRRRPEATFNVAIRTAVIDKSSGIVEFGAGGGVTWGSEPVAEDAELEAKAVVLTERRPEFQLLETLRVHDGLPVDLDEHLQRLASSAGYFGFGCDLDDARRRCLAAIGADSSPGARRMRILLSRDGLWDVELHPLEPASTTPIRLAIAPRSVRSDDVFCCHKTTNRGLYERIAAQHSGADDVLLGNERGEITETCRANLLFRIGDQWFTPPLSSGGLAGIARQQMLASGEAHERILAFEQLADVDEIAVISSLRGQRCAMLVGSTHPQPRSTTDVDQTAVGD